MRGRGRITRPEVPIPPRLSENRHMDGERIRCGGRVKMMRGQRRADLAGPEHHLQPATPSQKNFLPATAYPLPRPPGPAVAASVISCSSARGRPVLASVMLDGFWGLAGGRRGPGSRCSGRPVTGTARLLARTRILRGRIDRLAAVGGRAARRCRARGGRPQPADRAGAPGQGIRGRRRGLRKSRRAAGQGKAIGRREGLPPGGVGRGPSGPFNPG